MATLVVFTHACHPTSILQFPLLEIRYIWPCTWLCKVCVVFFPAFETTAGGTEAFSGHYQRRCTGHSVDGTELRSLLIQSAVTDRQTWCQLFDPQIYIQTIVCKDSKTDTCRFWEKLILNILSDLILEIREHYHIFFSRE